MFSEASISGHRESGGPTTSPWKLVLLFATICAASFAGAEFTQTQQGIATFWPSNAILLAVMVRSPRSALNYTLILSTGAAAIAAANLATGHGIEVSACLTLANVSEVAFAVLLLAWSGFTVNDLKRTSGLVLFIVLAGVVAPLAGATIGTAVVTTAQPTRWMPVWLNWYAADALGMLLVAPFALALNIQQLRALHVERRVAEVAVLLIGIILLAVFVSYVRPLIFLFAPAILIATARFGLVGAAGATLLVGAISTTFIVKDVGINILSQADIASRVIAIQVFLGVIAVLSFPVAVMLEERERLLSDLTNANERLAAEDERKSQLVTGLRRRLSNAEESERLRLAHELHDQTGQALVAVLLALKEVESSADAWAGSKFRLIRQQLEEMGKTLHRIAWELRPLSIEELGLASALRSYIVEWSARTGIEADFHCVSGGLDSLPDDVRTTIFRVSQEALTNIAKHARGVTAVSVIVSQKSGHLHLTIEDNGSGFELAGMQTSGEGAGRLGVAGMRERLLLIGGELEIESSPGLGTTIFARIPVEEQRTVS